MWKRKTKLKQKLTEFDVNTKQITSYILNHLLIKTVFFTAQFPCLRFI